MRFNVGNRDVDNCWAKFGEFIQTGAFHTKKIKKMADFIKVAPKFKC